MGTSGIDKDTKEAADSFIRDRSKNSKYGKNEDRLDEKRQQRIQKLKDNYSKLTWEQLNAHKSCADEQILELELSKKHRKVCCVVDMDAFFYGCHLKKDADLDKGPVGVGGMGMLTTANYKARAFGVRAAMPGYLARQLCPQLRFVACDYGLYVSESQAVESIVSTYDDSFSGPHSLDEFYLDITKRCHELLRRKNVKIGKLGLDAKWDALSSAGSTIAREIRKRIKKERGLTASVGIAANFLMAKVASNQNKPDGQKLVPFGTEGTMAFLRELPVSKINGIGKVSAAELEQVLGITTVGHIHDHRGAISAIFSEKFTRFLFAVSRGISRDNSSGFWSDDDDGDDGGGDLDGGHGCSGSSSGSTAAVARKSVGHSRTFLATRDTARLHLCIGDFAKAVAGTLKSKGWVAKKLTVKMKEATFEQSQASKPFVISTDNVEDIEHAAQELFSGLWSAKGRPLLRLVGVSVSDLAFADGAMPPPNKRMKC